MVQNKKKSINQSFIVFLLIGLWLFSAIQLIPIGINQYISNTHYDTPVIRVIANSNHKDDISIKENLANAIFLDGSSSAKMNEAITSNLSIYQKQDALIPPKWVNGKFYPQTMSDANIMQIGQGRGDNWFCGLFYKACGYSHKKDIKRVNKFKLSTFF